MKILALEGYYGGSHKAFLDGFISHSRHNWDLHTLPANKWKWRMRHGAFTLAQQVNTKSAAGKKWEAVFCSDMINLAEFMGLACKSIRDLPVIVYFHENQLTYPVQSESERDYQYVVTNFTTALKADAVWFNSEFHRDEFLTTLDIFFKRMPDNHPSDLISRIRDKSSVHYPGIYSIQTIEKRPSGPARLLWAARWEHDKNPEDFFSTLKIIKDKGIDFRLSVIGQQFRNCPEIFSRAKDYFSENIDNWGYQENVEKYHEVLKSADIVISTANHEFFGLSIIEAVCAGAVPLLPNRLSYPEIISNIAVEHKDEFLYDGTVEGLVDILEKQINDINNGVVLKADRLNTDMFRWNPRAAEMDKALEGVL